MKPIKAYAATVFRCDWCGRFYSSHLPEGSACRDHIVDHNERLAQDIAASNKRLLVLAPRKVTS